MANQNRCLILLPRPACGSVSYQELYNINSQGYHSVKLCVSLQYGQIRFVYTIVM